MIIIGYQGIGKTTLAYNKIGWIDLESTNFYVDGKKDDNWHKIYGNIAVSLSWQHYKVFTSSHLAFMDNMGEWYKPLSNIIQPYYRICCCYPCHGLKTEWLVRLAKRCNEESNNKNLRAFENAMNRFDESIDEIENCCKKYGFIPVPIESMDYNLEELIESKCE